MKIDLLLPSPHTQLQAQVNIERARDLNPHIQFVRKVADISESVRIMHLQIKPPVMGVSMYVVGPRLAAPPPPLVRELHLFALVW